MAKRGYKLQEFVAHSGSVNCLAIGKKTCRLFVSGGDDHKVNLWSIGEPNSLMSLCGHTSPVESVTFDSSEVLVVAGSSAGVIKLWDLEETKMVRTLTGHRSYCTAVEFHPFGDFFASGSMDTNLKIWDIRKKGCIHTYKGHSRGISTIRFSPDGRWVVSGGLDNVVKVWDLTAGKLLHDFKFHEGHIRTMAFHPLEFLLATGSADKTIKFWDLETFELIGSARPEATGVRSITFHPDGRTLFCGFDDSLKVYSWEPVIRHDTVDMGWSTLGDLCIHDGKLLGCSYYQDSIGVWVSDISLIEPYGGGSVPEQNSHPEPIHDIRESPLEKVGSHKRSTSSLRSVSPDSESREIKNIYVDSTSPVISKKVGSLNSPKIVLPPESKEVNLPTQKQDPNVGLHSRSVGRSNKLSFLVPSVVPRDNPGGNDSANTRRESLTGTGVITGMSQKLSHIRRPSAPTFDMERPIMTVESGSVPSKMGSSDTAKDPNFHKRVVSDNDAIESSEEIGSNNNSVVQKFEKVLSPTTHTGNGDESFHSSEGISSVKFVNGVAVVEGRTCTLVEKFEKREKVNGDEVQTLDTAPQKIYETAKTSPMPVERYEKREKVNGGEVQTLDTAPQKISMTARTSPTPVERFEKREKVNGSKVQTLDTAPQKISMTARTSPTPVERFEKREKVNGGEVHIPATAPRKISVTARTSPSPVERFEKREKVNGVVQTSDTAPRKISVIATTSPTPVERFEKREKVIGGEVQRPATAPRKISVIAKTSPTPVERFEKREKVIGGEVQRPAPALRKISVTASTSPTPVERYEKREKVNGGEVQTPDTAPRKISVIAKTSPTPIDRFEKREKVIGGEVQTPATAPRKISVTASTSPTPVDRYEKREKVIGGEVQTPVTAPQMISETAITSPTPNRQQQISGRESPSNNENDVEALMQNHDILLSTFRSRLTKLQVVRHFWERKDFKGAVNAMRKLPDKSVQADVISILVEKMEILNLDLFSLLLPVLLSLLDSKIERHISVSLEMLLKLVAVFGSVVRSTVSAPPAVGVDLQAEQRRECCNQCSIELQKIQRILPALVRRGGLVAKCALELNLLQQS